LGLSIIYTGQRTVHIGAAVLGIVVFWLPLLVQKGGRLHVLCGRIFVVCAAVTLVTGVVVSGWHIIDPIGSFPALVQPPAEQAAAFTSRVRLWFAFLGALAVYTFVPLVLAVRVVRTRHNPERMKGFGTRLLLWSEVGVGLALMVFASDHWIRDPTAILCAVLLGAGISGLGAAWWDLQFIAKPHSSAMFWWYKHMEFMLRVGIAFHTAFAVFVLTPWLGRLGSGSWALMPWFVPTAVGLPGIWLWVRHYRRQFGELSPVALAGAGMRTSHEGLQ
jgi:hypothetical protein